MQTDARIQKRNHEELVVEGPLDAVQRLRQDRFEPTERSCRAVIGGREFAVCNYSTFGLAVVASEPVACDEAVPAPLRLDDLEVARLRLKRVRVERLEDGRYKTAFTIVGEPLSVNRIEAARRTQQAIDEHTRLAHRARAVPAPFKLKVYEIRDALEALERLVERLAASAPLESFAEQREFEETVADVVAEHLDRLFSAAYDELAGSWDALGKEDVRRCHQFFREQLGHLLNQSPMFERSCEKPLGYAGDYEMMNFIYRNETLGRSLFARCVSRYGINHPNARAVRNRPAYLLRRIRERIAASDGRTLRILSVAAGPAREIQLLVDDTGFDPASVDITLLDQDAAALRNAHSQIRRSAERRGIEPRIRFLHQAVANVLKGGLTGEFDLIYSAGLFDYFSDPLARRAASRLFARLAERGELVIGNFRAVPQNQAFMELALDWSLIYRSEEDLRTLYHGIAHDEHIEAEDEGINLFVTLRR